MSMNKFIPDNGNLYLLNGLRKGSIHYNFIDPSYKTIQWSTIKTLKYKIKCAFENSIDKDSFWESLTTEEENELDKQYSNLENIPEETILKECIIVIICKKCAVGLKIIDFDNIVAFKSYKIKEVKALCMKNNIAINYDKYFALELFINVYLNEIIPDDYLEYLAQKYVKLRKINKVFAKAIESIWWVKLLN